MIGYSVDIDPEGSTYFKFTKWILVRQEVGQWVILGPGPVLDACTFPVPIPKVCTSCRTNIHIVKFRQWTHMCIQNRPWP